MGPGGKLKPQEERQRGYAMERRLLREPEARVVIGVGKTKLSELLSSGAIRSFKVGRARVIPVATIDEWIADQLAKLEDRQPEAGESHRERAGETLTNGGCGRSFV